MVVLALISDLPGVAKILGHLPLPTEPPPWAPARGSWEPQPYLLSPPVDDSGPDDPAMIASEGDILILPLSAKLAQLHAARPPP